MSDDVYFMCVLRAAKVKYPYLTPTQLYFGTCDQTGLPCLHPVDVRIYCGIGGKVLLRQFLDSEPPRRLHDPEYLRRVWESSFCPVCRTYGPKEPVYVS